jgi:hypothetical protein
MHDYTSLVFAALLIVHLFLHWMFFRNLRKNFKADAKEPEDCPT